MLYFSELLSTLPPYKKDWLNIKTALEANNISHSLLKGTKDIWCRDYMPIKISANKFVSFNYDPSYLKKYPELKSYPPFVIQQNNIPGEIFYSDIVLDGGNVIKMRNKAILTERIYSENSKTSKTELISELERLLEAEIIIIPCYDNKTDMTGHSDGAVRFLNEKEVLVYNCEDDRELIDQISDVLVKHKLEPKTLSSYIDPKKKSSARGCYINYLEVGQVIFYPHFGNSEMDKKADIEFAQYFSAKTGYTIVPVKINTIAADGGVLNCISWDF